MSIGMKRAHGPISRGVCVALVLALLAGSEPATAADKGACVAAAEAAQRLKKANKLVAAREQLLVCSSPDCPGIVSTDCTSWLGEVARSMASVTVKARDGQGRAVYNVRVLLDGAPFAAEASGAPLDVDPGPHVFRCERGSDAIEVSATVAEGERTHSIVCDMPTVVEPVAPAAPTSVGASPPHEDGLPWSALVLGGVGVLAAGTAAVFGGLELSQQSADAAPGGCKPYCKPNEIGSIQTKIDVAYVSAGVAVVAVGVAIAIALLRPGRGSSVASHWSEVQTWPASLWLPQPPPFGVLQH
jgi:hypothetical protein